MSAAAGAWILRRLSEGDLRKAGCVAIYRDPADLLAKLDESPIVR